MRKRKACSVSGCGNTIAAYGSDKCAHHRDADLDAALEAQVREDEAERIRLGLPVYWGCLDPECPICGS